MTSNTIADLLIAVLNTLGVKFAFGVPGGAIEPIYDALHKAHLKKSLTFITTRHEAAAAGMAEGVLRASNTPAICCATTGPGALNMVTAIASAFAESKPLIVLTAQTPISHFGQGSLQDSSSEGIDTTALLTHVTKYSSLLSHSQQLLPKLRKLWNSAKTAPCGPVHLSLPSDILSQAVSYTDFEKALMEVKTWSSSFGPAPLTLQHKNRLQAHFDAPHSVKPCIVLGEESIYEKDAILAFLNRNPWNVVTTSNSHGWFPTSHPSFKGVIGFAGHEEAKAVVAHAEKILVLGSFYREMCMSSTPEVLSSKTIHAAPTSRSIDATPGQVTCIPSDIASVLNALNDLNLRYAGNPVFPYQDTPFKKDMSTLPFNAPPKMLQHTLEQLVGPAEIFVDAGNAWSWVLHYISTPPDKRTHISMGFGQMAWAISNALGAAAANPQVTAVCVTGDGSWLMSSNELTTAVQHHLPVLFIILNDHHLGMVRFGQMMTGAQQAGHRLPSVDYVRLARASGALAVRVEEEADLLPVHRWASSKQPFPLVVELKINPDFAPPMGERITQLLAVKDKETTSPS